VAHYIVGVLGYGTMGRHIAHGIRARASDLEAVTYTRSQESRDRAALDGVRDLSEDPGSFFGATDIVVLCVKPQDLVSIGDTLREYTRGTRIVSVLAGTRTTQVRDRLGARSIARLMPSIAAKIGRGTVGVAVYDGPQDNEFAHLVRRIAQAIGTPVQISESLMPALTGLSGSGMAFAFQFLHGLALGGVHEGLNYEQATSIAAEMLSAAAALLSEETSSPSDLVARVASPGGTTISGLRSTESAGLTCAAMNAVIASAERARELER